MTEPTQLLTDDFPKRITCWTAVLQNGDVLRLTYDEDVVVTKIASITAEVEDRLTLILIPHWGAFRI